MLKVKDTRPVRVRAMIDFNRGIVFGRLREILKFEFKYGSWGAYPSLELEELETLTLAFLARHDKEAWDRRHITNVLPPEQSKKVQETAMDLTEELMSFYKGQPRPR